MPDPREEALPSVPELPDPAALTAMGEDELAGVVATLDDTDRRLRQWMAPLQERLNQLAKRQAVVATELRRRDRQRHLAQRKAVREQVQEGQAPSLLQLVQAADRPDFGEASFSALEFLLETGGLVALGYPGSKVPSLQMSDGATVATVADLAEARRLYSRGWEFGVAARAGVRVHTPGTRLERLLPPEKCFVRPIGAAPRQPAPAPADGGS